MDRRRVVFFLVLVLVPFGGLEARLAWIQLFHRDVYAGSPRRRSLELSPAARGRILDRAGRVLAQDELSFDLWVVLEEFERRPETHGDLGRPDLEASIERIYQRIERAIGRRPERERHRLYARERRTPYLLARSIPRALAIRIETDADRFPGCQVRESYRRHYPEGPVGALVVGTLGLPVRDDTRDEPKMLLESAGLEDPEVAATFAKRGAFDDEMLGRTGVERFCQEQLRGRPGLLIQERDPRSGEQTWVALSAARPGEDIELTLDLDLQRAVQEIIGGVSTATVAIVLDPPTGEVLALATNLPLDPNHFIPPTNTEALRSYQTRSGALLNRATQELYPLGSVFKIVTAIAALEELKIDPHRQITCTGAFIAGASHTRCHNRTGCGPLDLAGALERSCNFTFYQLGQELYRLGREERHADVLAAWAERLGLGISSGIELGDRSGLLPRPVTDAGGNVSTERYLAIGQGLAVTPLQAARLIAVIANGGTLVRPHVVRGHGRNESLSLQPQTLAAVRRGLWQVVHGPHGTAAGAGFTDPDTCGKTGSAQVGGGQKAHAWFVGFDSRAVVVVLVEHGEAGGQAAAPLAAKIFEKVKEGSKR